MSPKKMKIDQDFRSQSVSNAQAELELEIKIKERVLATLESRITWATALQEALEKGQNNDVTSSAFKYAALDALSAAEAPLSILYDHEPQAPPNVQLLQAQLSRPPPKPKPPLFRNKASFLYIKPSAIDFVPLGGGPHLPAYLLKCPVCERTTFTSLQGLLNHARISHSLEWGTHDECVRACAVVDPSIDLDAGIEVGLGSGGILPGLRSIFQMAIGSQAQVKTEDCVNNAVSEYTSGISSPGNFMSRTLGVHEDTPALAPFLGKEPIRRGIKVWNPDEEVDIDSIPIKTNALPTMHSENHRSAWRMRFQPRNIACASDDSEKSSLATTEASRASPLSRNPMAPDMKPESSSNEVKPAVRQGSDAPYTPSGSRFHFSARVSIVDRSLYISKDIQCNYTHKWMISVDSPSYSQNITTILQGIEVTCALGNEEDIKIGHNAKEPPFVSVGFASKPFLARIELFFNSVAVASSDTQYQRAIIEHWVELDPLNICSPVVGEEQVIDVELDKHTVINPRRTGYVPMSSKILWDLADLKDNQQPLHESDHGYLEGHKIIRASAVSGYEKVLSSLMSKFPLTQDMKGGKTVNVPYRLASSLKEFNNLIMGRRKAIQWGRAKAIQESYSLYAAAGNDEGLPALSTADVYTWLVENGHFPQGIDLPTKPAPLRKKTEVVPVNTEDKVERWCRVCGINIQAHSAANMFKQEDRGDESRIKLEVQRQTSSHSIIGQECIIAPKELQIIKLPPLDLRHALTDISRIPIRVESSPWPFSREVVALADPRLTLGVRNVVKSLDLPRFKREKPTCNASVAYPIDDLGNCRSEIETELSAHAFMALLTKRFTEILVKGGLEVAKRDGLAASSYAGGRKRKGKSDDNVKILTPVHILSSILSRGLGRTHRPEGADKAILWCLSRLGVLIDSEEARHNLEQNMGMICDGGQHVKVEERGKMLGGEHFV